MTRIITFKTLGFNISSDIKNPDFNLLLTASLNDQVCEQTGF